MYMRHKISALLLLLFLISLAPLGYARESFNEHFHTHPQPKKPAAPSPWFTGPILTPSAHVVPCGHINYEPYFYWTQDEGIYDRNWRFRSRPIFTNVLSQGSIQFGVFKNIEFDMAPQLVFNRTRKQQMWRVSDLPLTFAYQLLDDFIGTKEQWYPAIKLRIGLNVPLGSYDNLNPVHLGTDAGGIGTWYPGIGFVFSKLFHICGIHFLSTRLFLTYNFGTPVRVHGLSIYGGVPPSPGIPGTRGTFYPGNFFLLLNGYEFSITQNWVFALDFQYQHTERSRFSGFSPPGTRPFQHSQELFAFAPGIEYNWNANVGLIAGPWFTVAGRNTQKFISYVIALNVYV